MLVCDVRLGPSRVCALGGGWHVGAVDRPGAYIDACMRFSYCAPRSGGAVGCSFWFFLVKF